MDILEAIQKVHELGYPIATIAKQINRDPSTLNKWIKGTRNVSEDIEEAVRNEIRRLKEEWLNIDI